MSKTNWKSISISALGNILEWFDYALYGAFSSIIAKNFFPYDNPTFAQLCTYMIFAIGFIGRPLGGIIFGHIGDLYGRKKALFYSILLMAIPTAAIGFLPTYSQGGAFSSIALIVIRLCQGIAIGGEYTGSMVYLIEQSSPKYKTFTGSLSEMGCILGTLLGGQVSILILSIFMERSAVESWGWRIPFIFGISIIAYAYYANKNITETLDTVKQKKNNDLLPIITAFKHYWGKLLAALFSTAFTGISFYLILVFLPNYFFSQQNLPGSNNAFVFSTITNVVMIFSVMSSGYIADKIGLKPVLLFGIIGVMLTCYPMMYMASQGLGIAALICQVACGASLASFYGARTAFMSDVFPPQIRLTAVSLVMGVCQAVFGGTTPFIATYITSVTGSTSFISIILIIVCTLAIISVCSLTKIDPKTLESLKKLP